MVCRTTLALQGWIEFTVRPSEPLSHGMVIYNEAEIVFDINDPILTPEVMLQVDTFAPVSTMKELPPQTTGTSIPLSWSADDLAGVGVWDYTVKASVNGGPFEPWLAYTTDTQAIYEGKAGEQVQFLVVARDRFGNEEVKATGDAMTRISGATGGASGDEDGCGCQTVGGGSRSVALWSLVLAGLGLMFRRRVFQ